MYSIKECVIEMKIVEGISEFIRLLNMKVGKIYWWMLID